MSPPGPDVKKSFACLKCGNRLRILAEQVGSQIRCPKCGAAFVVAKSGPGPTRAGADDDDAYEPEIPLKPSKIVDDSPQVALAPVSLVDDSDWRTARFPQGELPTAAPRINTNDEHLQQAKAKGILRNERAIKPPPSAFFSGVFDFPFRGENVTRWTGMAFGLILAAEALLLVANNMTAEKSLNWLAMPLLSIFAAVIVLLAMSYCSPCFLAAIQDTADGHREVLEGSLPPWDQWFFSCLSVVTVLVVSGAAGYPFTLAKEIGPLAIPVSTVVLFPVLLLSAMEGGSFMMPFSPPVLASLYQKFGAWLGFYLVSTALWGAWLAATIWAMPHAPPIAAAAAGIALAWVMLVYARLLGRMAWTSAASR